MKKKILCSVGRLVVGGVIVGMSHLGMAAEWQKPVYVPSDGESKGARVVYEYKDDSLFYVNTKLGFVNDIELRPGEVVTHIAGGDTKRWLIDKAMVGNVQHVYIKPIEPDIDTNIIINTNQRAYRLYVIASNDYDPLISFTFPDSLTGGPRLRVPEDDPPVYGDKVNRNYEIRVKRKADKALIPLEIFDDGRQTFIRISKDNKYDLPVLYSIDPWNKKNISMVNYRVKGEYFIVDGVFPHGRLFYQQKFWIDFFNLEKKKTVKGTMPANQSSRSYRSLVVYDDTDEEERVDEGLGRQNVEASMRDDAAVKEERLREEQMRKEKELERKEQAAREKELARRQEEERNRQIAREEALRKAQVAEREELIRQQQKSEKEEAERQKKLAREEKAKAKAEAKAKRIRERNESRQRREASQQVEDFRRRKQAEAQAAYDAAEPSYDEMYRNASADDGASEGAVTVDKETKEKIYREALERQQVYDVLYKDRKKKAGERK